MYAVSSEAWCSALCEVCSVVCVVCSVLCTVCSVLCTVCSVHTAHVYRELPTCHDVGWDGEDLTVHHELLVLGQFHEDDPEKEVGATEAEVVEELPEVCATKVEGEELTLLGAIG